MGMDAALLMAIGTVGAVVAALIVISVVVLGGGAAVRALKLPVDLPPALRFLPAPPPVRPSGDPAAARGIAERQALLVAIHALAGEACQAAARASEIEGLCLRTANAAVTAACAERARAAATAADTARALPEEQARPAVEIQLATARSACAEAEAAMGPVHHSNLHLWVLGAVLILLLVLLWAVHPHLGAPLHAGH